ncbi:MAG: sigma-70 family RNA polymerase sigma factor [Fimbriimonadaceae bacterium]|nr:sigma-70 family RNA polymerase sigma factor [Fimbriimonadaceae bacterium]
MTVAVAEPHRMHYDDDLALVERYLAGDETAFGTLYGKYYERVYAIAKGVLLDREDAADAAQEIFTLVVRHLHRFDRRSRFSTWLFRIAVNRSIQYGRKTKHKARNVELNEAMAVAEEQKIEIADPLIQAALAKLKPNDRALITLFYWEELSLQEIAESLGCNVNAAKTRLYRARERFREVYEELGVDEP